MRKIHYTAVILFSLGLAACAAQPTLDEKLAGKTEAEKKAILVQECALEANRDHIGYGGPTGTKKDYPYFSHIRRMTEICDAIAKENKTGVNSHEQH